MTEDLKSFATELAAAWGPDLLRIRRLVCILADGDWHTLSQLIQTSTISHRTAREILHRLEPWLERNGARWRVRGDAVDTLASIFACASLRDDYGVDTFDLAASSCPAVVNSMADILNQLPPSLPHLDHVPVTPLTAAKRALYLSQNYDLAHAQVLCLGDHDLTSIALAHLRPAGPTVVVDLDERILTLIADLAVEHRWNIRPTFTDLRLELPRSLVGQADIVVTDPPYSPTGMELFLARALQSLRDHRGSRLVVSYGFSERHPTLGYKIQCVFQRLRLVIEAVLPAFNKYEGAEAIGSASDLYVLRPTRRSWPAAETCLQSIGSRIYTKGGAAEEAPRSELPIKAEQLLTDLVRQVGPDVSQITVVGEGWSDSFRTTGEWVSLSGYLKTMYSGQGRPPFTKPPHSDLVLVNLFPHYSRYLVRLFLLSAAKRLLTVCAIRDADSDSEGLASERSPLHFLISTRYDLKLRQLQQSDGLAVFDGTLVEAPRSALGFVLRYIVDHRRAKLTNAWREGLIAYFARVRDRRVTKNEVRQAIAETAVGRLGHGSYLTELPSSSLAKLIDDVGTTLQRLEGSNDQ